MWLWIVFTIFTIIGLLKIKRTSAREKGVKKFKISGTKFIKERANQNEKTDHLEPSVNLGKYTVKLPGDRILDIFLNKKAILLECACKCQIEFSAPELLEYGIKECACGENIVVFSPRRDGKRRYFDVRVYEILDPGPIAA